MVLPAPNWPKPQNSLTQADEAVRPCDVDARRLLLALRVDHDDGGPFERASIEGRGGVRVVMANPAERGVPESKHSGYCERRIPYVNAPPAPAVELRKIPSVGDRINVTRR
jgi:hypothetical protein